MNKIRALISVFFQSCLVLITGCEGEYYGLPVGNAIYTFTDNRDNTTYSTVTIDSQTWMAENLAYIPFIGKSKQEGIWVYDFPDTSIDKAKTAQNYILYGCLYNWEMAKNACPSGWHLPSDNEWKKLTDYIRNDGHLNCDGAALKSSTGWMNGNGTDDYGFDALPAGARNPYGDFYYKRGRTIFWTTTPKDSSYTWAYDLVHTTTSIRRYAEAVSNSFSVRCIKD